MQFEIRFIKLAGKYLMWASNINAPISYAFADKAEVEAYIAREFGEYGKRRTPNIMLEADWSEKQIDKIIAGNTAGPNNSELTKDQIIDAYVLRKPLVLADGKEWKA